MKKQILFTILFSFLLTGFFHNQLSAQKWSGGGDGTSWNDPNNWDSGAVPEANALLIFQKAAVVTGTAPNNPGQIKIQKNIEVTLDLDLTFGDGVLEQHALTVAEGSTLNLGVDGNNRTFHINIAPNKQCVAIFNNLNAVINIAESTHLNIVQGQFGINVGNETCTTTNRGTITFDTLTTTGIKTVGTFHNYGVIQGIARSNGIIVNTNGTFTNTETGMIEVGATVDEGLELLDGATFTNSGSLNLTGSATAGRNNSALAINAVSAPAMFIHNSLVPLNIAGTSDSSSILKVDTLGAFENHAVVNFAGTNADSSILVNGSFHNMPGAYFNITSGSVNVAETGSFTNDYVFTVGDAASTFITAGSSTNNGFYQYASESTFSEGSGIINDNGLPFVSTHDAGGSCTVGLANLSLEWFEDGVSIGTSDETGSLTFAPSSLKNKPTVLTPIIEGVEVTVENYCPEAWIDPARTDELFGAELRVYPTSVADGELHLEWANTASDAIVRVFDLSGRIRMETGIRHTLDVSHLEAGLYFLGIGNGNGSQMVRFSIAR